MKKIISNNKGSTLLLLVISLAVISILGTSVMAVTMMNLKVKKTNTEIKETFYKSESGLDKAYDVTYNLVIDAINKSNKSTQVFLQQFNQDKLNALVEKIVKGESDPDHIYLKDTNGDGKKDSYDDDIIQSKAKSEFLNYFYKYLTESNYGESHKNIVKLLNEISDPDVNIAKDEVGKYKIFYNGMQLSTDGNDNIEVVSLNSKDKLDIDIQSTANIDGIKKTTSVTLSITIPEYNKPYTISSSIISGANTLLSNKVLIANKIEKDIKVTYNPSDGKYVSDTVSFAVGNDKEYIIIDNKKYTSSDVILVKSEHDIIIITDKKVSIAIGNKYDNDSITMTIKANEIILETKRDNLNMKGLIMTSNQLYLDQTSNSGFSFKGVLMCGNIFYSQTGNQPSNLTYSDYGPVIDNAITKGAATADIKTIINSIYDKINKGNGQSEIIIKKVNSTDLNIANLIEIKNWSNN